MWDDWHEGYVQTPNGAWIKKSDAPKGMVKKKMVQIKPKKPTTERGKFIAQFKKGGALRKKSGLHKGVFDDFWR